MEVIYYFALFSTDSTHSTDEHVHLQTKNFKIDYKFRSFCTFFKFQSNVYGSTQLLTRYFRFIKPLQKRFRQKFSAQYLCRKKFMYIYPARRCHAKSDVMSNITSQQGGGSQGQGPLAVPDPDAAQEIPKTLETLE